GLGETTILSREARIFIANCDLKENSIELANEQFETLLTEARDAAVLEGLGVVAVRLQNYDLAAGYLNEAIMLDTERWRSWNALGVALDVQGAPEEAAEAFGKAATLNPRSAAPFNNLGVLYMKQKQYVDAISAFNEALAIDPELEAADNNYRIALALNGDYENALAGASEAQLAQFLNNAGVAASARGDLPSAKKFLKAALNESPTFYATAYENLIRLPNSAGE
ncbi:MAG: tetratricopeptide repeat protein, partial [Marinicaulis sp.]|nr:tetratricopeptide repeat protein [Marinicaulis sp.]